MAKEIWGSFFSSKLQESGTGIAIIDGDSVTGGTSSFYYMGKCDFRGNSVSIRLFVKKFAPGRSILYDKLPEYTIAFTGTRTENEANLRGYIEQHPEIKVQLRMKKLDEYHEENT